jgi:hypothetical protein
MNLFIKTIINYQKNNNMSFSLDTNFDIPRDRNYYCDTNFHDNSKIWFAKGDSKNTNKKYLEKLDFFTRFSYTL